MVREENEWEHFSFQEKRRGRYWWLILLIGVLVVFSLFHGQPKGRRRAAGGLPDPVQVETSGVINRTIGGYTLTINKKASYDITALVVSTHNYSGSDIGSLLAPRDIALAWGPVAENNLSIDFHWKQSGRWVSFYVNDLNQISSIGGIDGVTCHMSNNHLIASGEDVKKQIAKIKTGDVVRLKGYLVFVDGVNKSGQTMYWYSSTSRTDTGDGACEVFYVTEVDWIRK